MPSKTANVIARVEPEVKNSAESIIESLGLSVSGVINILYRQIILKKGIPFSITLNAEPKAFDEMNRDEFDKMLETGYAQALQKKGKDMDVVMEEIRGNLK